MPDYDLLIRGGTIIGSVVEVMLSSRCYGMDGQHH
jgi:hypothetical protein